MANFALMLMHGPGWDATRPIRRQDGWDEHAAFMDRLVKDPAELAQTKHLEYVREAGAEGIELVMWLIMRGALGPEAEELYRFYHVPGSNTAVGHLVLRPTGSSSEEDN